GANNDLGYSLSADRTGCVYVAGEFELDTITFDGYELIPDSSYTDPMFMVKYDPAGNVLCASLLDCGGGGASVSSDLFGNAYASGAFNCHSFTVDTTVLAANSVWDIFLAKYRCENGVAVPDLSSPGEFSAFPNPAGDFITFRLPDLSTSATLIITDNLGREVKRQQLNGEKQVQISVADLADGIYFYRFTGENGIVSTGKFIIQR
ncbi:MAG TPA: T9SS type A sorting domain-containing protein, partial [Bacteroidia bacterium]|nr:T9SS type A sorting domain-containing protein [Bacteroidia bacterium]